MVEMARACTGILATAPQIDLWDGPSAHDSSMKFWEYRAVFVG